MYTSFSVMFILINSWSTDKDHVWITAEASNINRILLPMMIMRGNDETS